MARYTGSIRTRVRGREFLFYSTKHFQLLFNGDMTKTWSGLLDRFCSTRLTNPTHLPAALKTTNTGLIPNIMCIIVFAWTLFSELFLCPVSFPFMERQDSIKNILRRRMMMSSDSAEHRRKLLGALEFPSTIRIIFLHSLAGCRAHPRADLLHNALKGYLFNYMIMDSHPECTYLIRLFYHNLHMCNSGRAEVCKWLFNLV